MSIGSYPRVTVQGTGATNNPANGLGLMLYNSTTGQYEAATAATFGGGGGAGGATEINQETQIIEAQNANNLLTTLNASNFIFGRGTAEYLNDIYFKLNDINSQLNALTSGAQKVQIVDSTGNAVSVTGNKLDVNTGA